MTEKAGFGPSPLEPLAGRFLLLQEIQSFWLRTLALSFGIEAEARKIDKVVSDAKALDWNLDAPPEVVEHYRKVLPSGEG